MSINTMRINDPMEFADPSKSQVDTMAYTGEVPWHGIGTPVDKYMTSVEALQLGGLDWDVELVPLQTNEFTTDSGVVIPAGISIPSARGVVRSDKNIVLGSVTKSYRPIQNREAFTFFDGIVGEKLAMYETVGSLRDGRIVWLSAKIPGEIRVNKTDDITEQYLLLSEWHDGTGALKMLFTPVRTVCNNTLRAALAGTNDYFRVTHKGDPMAKLEEGREALGFAVNYYKELGTIINQLADREVTQVEVDEVFEKLIPFPTNDEEESTRSKNKRLKLNELFETGMGNDMPGIKGTAYAALNAVTEYIDHYGTYRAAGGRARGDARMDSVLFGTGAAFKQKAFDVVTELIK